MSGFTDKVKGKLKEIGGVISGHRDLEAKGKAEQVKGNVEEKAENIKDSVKDIQERREVDKSGESGMSP